MKVAFIVGHTRVRKGAYSKHLLKYEYDFYKDLENYLKPLGDVFYHNYLIYGYNSRQKHLAKHTKDYDLVFELHFNSANGKAEGCEALYYHKNEQTKLLSQIFCDEYTDMSGSRNRGAKPLRTKKDRGFGFVYNQKPPAILIEPFFGDNAIDCARFTPHNLFEALRKTISCYDLLKDDIH